MRALIAILVLVLVVLGIGAAFAAGYLANDVAHPNRVDISSSDAAKADQAAAIEADILKLLQAHYYEKVDVDKLQGASIKAMLKPLDPWTQYMTPKETKDFADSTNGNYAGVGAALKQDAKRLIVTQVFDGSPAKEAGIRVGDWIVTVDGQPTAGKSVEANVGKIRGPAGSDVVLQIRHAGSDKLITLPPITRRQIPIPETKTRLIEKNGKKIGYIQLFQFARGVGATIHSEIQKLQGQGAEAIVLDLRFNGGGLLDEAVNVTSDFLGKGVVVITKGLHEPKEVLAVRPNRATSLPMVVLVNHWTVSAAEITTGSLQDNRRAEIIGMPTYGKDLVQKVYDLPGGATLKMSIAKYLTPDGTDLYKRGILPDIKVKDLPKTKTDEQLQRALTYLTTGQ
jgi:carboxyl-terminal processing protease